MQQLSLPPLICQLQATQATVKQKQGTQLSKKWLFKYNYHSLFTSMPHIFLPTSVMLKTGVIKCVLAERKQKGLLITGKGCSSHSGAHHAPCMVTEEGVLKRFLQTLTFSKNIPQKLIYSFD